MVGYVVTTRMLYMAFEHLVQVLRLPSESHRQGFERATAPPTHDSVPLDFPHDGSRNSRALRQLTLTQAQLAYTVADSSRDRSPVLWIAFQHVFLCVPLPTPRVADLQANPYHEATISDDMTSLRESLCADISHTAPISALNRCTGLASAAYDVVPQPHVRWSRRVSTEGDLHCRCTPFASRPHYPRNQLHGICIGAASVLHG
jgi:hypothetical protein